jgi:predicted MPP superfamily phosphohydrolase
MGAKIPVCTFKNRGVKIVILGDVHLGQKACAKERFLKTIDFIAKDKNVFVILGGDLVEMVTRSQKGNMLLEQVISPTQQLIQIEDILKPLAKKGKILGIVKDNHLARLEKDALVDMNEKMAYDLGVQYWGVGGIVILNVQGRKYKLAIQHGKDSAINEFTALNKMMRNYPDCDIYVLGHDHKLSARKIVTLHAHEDGTECGREHYQIRSGSYLKMADYARECLYEPSVIGSPIISFKEDGRVKVDIETLSWGIN